MLKTIGREIHKMHAFLRFRERPEGAGDPRFVAWFEPAHDVLPQAASHFARRMGYASWLIATPEATAAWDGKRLQFGPPSAQGPLDIDDAGERLWLTYYRSTFNPARLNTQVMELNMPVRYWKNMPEARLIPELISHAAAGAQRTAQTETVGARRGVAVQIRAEEAQPQRAAAHALESCRRCNLWCHATQAVPGVGPKQARIMLVGEQPGDQEDLAGLPFVGPAGQLLDRALAQAGIGRETVYVTNAVKHFKWEPRGKRRLHKTPAQLEIDACMTWLEQEIAECDPVVIVTLGSTALKSVMHAPRITMQAVAGTILRRGSCMVVPTWHPSFILRTADRARQQSAFDDLVEALQNARDGAIQDDRS
uniref:UdgX family uracil-DNA binding protein n=1 Tax=uncultured Oxalicibacterium sp. TaxID=1168540 RepID=UPI0025E0645A